ncbi:MAG TPA: hypothetical protein VE569_10305 [Acidimicrobiia bacterium]|nr:hypothetical protein [Acidimicrobiia bacterium]
MATTQTTQLSRGGQFSGWRMWVLLVAAVALVATLAGRNVFDGNLGQTTRQQSVHNLIEGVDEFGAAAARVFSPPRVGNLLEGVDENSTPAPAESAAADTAAASATQTPHNLFEGVDASATAGTGTAAISAYTMLKLEQAKGDETADGGQASPSEKPQQHNLVEGP